MGETRNEIPWFRETGDHPPGRALSPAGPTNPGHARYPADDILPLVCALAGGRARGTGRQALSAQAGVEPDPGGDPGADRRTGAGRAGAVAAGGGDALYRPEEVLCVRGIGL